MPIVAGNRSDLCRQMGIYRCRLFDHRFAQSHHQAGEGHPRPELALHRGHAARKLVDVGLTSMDMVNLMLGVEAEFDFTIPQSEITPENFQSVETLERMVAAQLQSAAAA